MSATTYLIHNSAVAGAAAPVKQPTGAAIRTMLQIALSSTMPGGRIIEWGCSFDGSAAATPGLIELVETTLAATVSSASAAADIQQFADANAPANTAGSSGVPFNLGTALTGFATAAGTENAASGTFRMADLQMVAPTNQYVKQFPLGREFELIPGRFLRVRATFGTTINMYCYCILEI